MSYMSVFAFAKIFYWSLWYFCMIQFEIFQSKEILAFWILILLKCFLSSMWRPFNTLATYWKLSLQYIFPTLVPNNHILLQSLQHTNHLDGFDRIAPLELHIIQTTLRSIKSIGKCNFAFSIPFRFLCQPLKH